MVIALAVRCNCSRSRYLSFLMQSRSIANSQLQSSSDIKDFFKPEALQLLTQRQFLNISLSKPIVADILGREIINNLHSEWRRSLLVDRNDVKELGTRKLKQRFTNKDICNAVFDGLKASSLPLAFTANLFDPDHFRLDETLVYVKVLKKSSAELDFENEHAQRVWWLKSYLRKPAQIITEWGSNSPAGSSVKEVAAQYVCNDHHLVVQTSCLLHEEQLKSFGHEVSSLFGEPTSVIIIKHDLFNLLCTILADAYHTIKFPNYQHTLMRIHPYLAPVKTAVSMDGNSSELLELADEMTDWIRDMGISCWNAVEMGLNYTDLDHCGVLHTIVVSQKTFDDGILVLRSRDSSLEVQTHVTELKDKFRLYFQPR